MTEHNDLQQTLPQQPTTGLVTGAACFNGMHLSLRLLAQAQFVAVGTPPDEDCSADTQYVLAVAERIATHINEMASGPKFPGMFLPIAENISNRFCGPSC